MKAMKEWSQSLSAVEADCQTVGALPGIELIREGSPTYSLGQIRGV